MGRIMDYPKLKTPLICLVAAALFLALTVRERGLPDWARFFMALLALVFGTVGIITLADWLVYNAGNRLREFNLARTSGAVSLANALRGLTTFQTEAILAGEKVAMQLIPGDADPILFVRGLTRSIPWDFVQEFLEKSQLTAPYLYPVRESGNEAFATDFTNLVVSLGWADKATGPFSAKLNKPLPWVAARFWVTLEEGESYEQTDKPG